MKMINAKNAKHVCSSFICSAEVDRVFKIVSIMENINVLNKFFWSQNITVTFEVWREVLFSVLSINQSELYYFCIDRPFAHIP